MMVSIRETVFLKESENLFVKRFFFCFFTVFVRFCQYTLLRRRESIVSWLDITY